MSIDMAERKYRSMREMQRAAEQQQAMEGNPKGIRCPQCGCTSRSVYKTLPDDNSILRITFCDQCKYKNITKEIPA